MDTYFKILKNLNLIQMNFGRIVFKEINPSENLIILVKGEVTVKNPNNTPATFSAAIFYAYK
jgi:hypothetical protein